MLRYILLVAFLFTGCERSCRFEDDARPRILSTTAMIGDLVERIGGERIHAMTLIRGEVDPHSYELIKGDGEKFSCAQLIFSNGLRLECGGSVRRRLEVHPNVVRLGDRVVEEDPSALLFVDGSIDPHMWMDVSLWARTTAYIKTALSEIDPEGEAFYCENAKQLERELIELDREIERRMREIPENRRYLVTSHDAFHFFARRYLGEPWQERCVAPEGLAPESQLSSKDIREVADHIVRYEISVLFPETNLNRDSLRKLVDACQRRGQKVRISNRALYGDSVGKLGYIGMMRRNVETLEGEWTHDRR